MELNKYVSLDKLTKYDTLIKTEINRSDESILSDAKEYTNNAVAQKASALFITWETDD